MHLYVLRRLLQLGPVLLGVTAITFLLTRLSGDPSLLLLPEHAGDAERQAFRNAYGLDRPLVVQFVIYSTKLLQGDFGVSFGHGEPALSLVLGRLPATLELSLASLLVVVLVGIPMGVLAAVNRGRVIDWIATVGILLGQSVATFWLGLMLIMIFAVRWPLFPPSGRSDNLSLVLPSLTLAMYLAALITRLTRSGMLDALSADYIRTARAKGLAERALVWRHALKNVLIPAVTVLGVQFGTLLAGSVVTESVFNWPGVGLLVMDAIYRRDYPVIQTAVFLFAIGYVSINLLVDIACAYLDPRIRCE